MFGNFKTPKPPMICAKCGTRYLVDADSQLCGCGQMLYRVAVHNGHLIGPPEMPESVRADMQRQYDARMGQAIDRALAPRDVRGDAAAAFHNPAEMMLRRDEFYAGWAAYDQAIGQMGYQQQDLQRRAEVLALEQLWALS